MKPAYEDMDTVLYRVRSSCDPPGCNEDVGHDGTGRVLLSVCQTFCVVSLPELIFRAQHRSHQCSTKFGTLHVSEHGA